jgi:hypothetical protein
MATSRPSRLANPGGSRRFSNRRSLVMQVVHKFPFQVKDRVSIAMPRGAMILKVECQCETPCVWALVDPEAPSEMRRFHVFGTGHPIDLATRKVGEHVATFQHGRFVRHVFKDLWTPETR